MKRFFLVIFFAIGSLTSNSQHRSNYWGLGYNSFQPDTLNGGMLMSFNNGNYSLTDYPRLMWFDASNASICDNLGNLLFYTNGIWIANSVEDTMLNGTGLNPSWYTNQWSFWGMQIPQGDIIIPKPGDSSKYYLFHETIDIPVIYYPNKLYATTIDMQGDSGRGEVIDKNNIIINDTLIAGALTACKHANGRDWWLIVPEYGTELGFYTFLITPDTIEQINYQKANASGYGPMQSCFSPDGSMYVISNYVGIAFYDFDRCNGTMSFRDSIFFSDSIFWIGTSVSPNSRYCYLTHGFKMLQYDLQAANIPSSQTVVCVYDTFAAPFPPWWTTYYLHQIAPDGKIYISCPGTTMAMHVINYPDSAGFACDMQQHAILLPHFNATIPNFPNYNLGPLLGSVCDSLGLSVAENETHNFNFKNFPNPNDGYFKISYRLPQNKNGLLQIIDITGKIVYTQNLPQWSTLQQIIVSSLSEGIYSCVISSGGFRVSKTIAIIND